MVYLERALGWIGSEAQAKVNRSIADTSTHGPQASELRWLAPPSRRRSRRRLVLGLTIACALATGCRDRFAHGLRTGTLSQVGSTSIGVYFWEHQPVVTIANEASDGACLQLAGLHVTVDGVPQAVGSWGTRESGQHKGDFGPADRSDFCSGATVAVHVPSDPSRPSDTVEVSDGTLTLRAEFPNVFADTAWSKPPPATVHAGEAFRVRIVPEPPRGLGDNDALNYVAGVFKDDSGRERDLVVTTHKLTDGEFELSVPPAAKPGVYQLSLVSAQGEIPAKSCSARECRGASEFVLTAPVHVVP